MIISMVPNIFLVAPKIPSCGGTTSHCPLRDRCPLPLPPLVMQKTVATRQRFTWPPYTIKRASSKILLQHGVDVHAKDKGGLVPLHNAYSYGHYEVRGDPWMGCGLMHEIFSLTTGSGFIGDGNADSIRNLRQRNGFVRSSSLVCRKRRLSQGSR